ncbi:MAG: CoA transferase [Pseudomonadales bacterium]|mgnify:CR=1 FL=1|jgi:crotonobetainyl-CoA:carnitine CoA-transferase CaiB-like acyl-CoA transferase|nr:CoA transferase [Pseudomonadales bacterium]MDP6472342.1 CoA transferase [Pseudomonadales bacterium]MDP6828138.1 CoA transferase [Pseudomonadales bacterium]MDP6973477.1 CoA transferase [Pseudomonadales bacterium]
MAGPLEGVRVLDLTTMVSGPIAAAMLADQGADVIKVESPSGDEMRRIGNQRNGLTAGFFSCNRGKRSLCVDLKNPDARKPLEDLVKTADVFVQNFRPGAVERIGFGEEAVRKLNPDIVYVSISGFGEHGPYAHQRVYDPVIQALTGATDIQADRDTKHPKMFRIIIADKVTSLTAAQAITAALFARERGGGGQHVKLSMLDTMISFFWPEGMSGITFVGDEIDVTKYQGTMDLIYETRNGYITAGAISDQEWLGMCAALGQADWVEDARFRTTTDRFRNAELRKQMTAAEIAKWDRDELLARLDAEGVPSAPLLTRLDLLEHEQIAANDTIGIYEFEGHGQVRQARPAARFDITPQDIKHPAPLLGEHSATVLAEIGYGEDTLVALFASGAVRSANQSGSDSEDKQ